MPRLEPLPLEAIGDLQPSLEAAKSRMGFLPNSQLIMARRPEILRAFQQLGMAINGPSSTITPELRNMVSQMASRAAGCGYCMAHTAHTASRVGIPPEKEEALWEYETSPLFSAAERAALSRSSAFSTASTTRWRPSWNPRRSRPASAFSRRGAGPSASTPADRKPARGPHASERASSTGHPGISPASQRRTASASARFIAVRSAILARISAR
jgi:hypothetical protein